MVAALGACGGDDPDQVGVWRAAIIGGRPDAIDSAVVAVVACQGSCRAGFGDHPANPREYCSGVLVAPRVVLTARHCLAPLVSDDGSNRCDRTRFGAPAPATDVAVTEAGLADPRGGDGATWRPVRRVEVVPGDGYCGNDVAALLLVDDLPGVQPLSVRTDAPPTVGDHYAAIGFGRYSPDDGAIGQRLRLDDLTVRCLGAACPAAADGAPSASDGEFGGQRSGCLGDSGGPALDSDGRVLGLLGHGNVTCDDPIYERLDLWHDWLGTVAAAAIAAPDDGAGCALAPARGDARGGRWLSVLAAILLVLRAARQGPRPRPPVTV